MVLLLIWQMIQLSLELILSQLIQTVISRRLNPFDDGVITIGSFDGKGTFNVIKDAVELEGDVRYMTVETQKLIEKEVHRIVKGIEVEFGVSCELTYTADYPPLYNDPKVTADVVAALESMKDPDIKEIVEGPMISASEDFSYYLEKIQAVSLTLVLHQKV